MLHQALSVLPSQLCREQEGFDRWLCCKKDGTLILVTLHKSHFASLKTKVVGTGGKKHFSLGDGGIRHEETQLGIAIHPMACVFAG